MPDGMARRWQAITAMTGGSIPTACILARMSGHKNGAVVK
jgi:hypothetical protein